jgi:signal transduction histidine kinase
MTAIGGQIGQFMERLYAEGSLTQSEKRYRTIFETVGISLWEEDFSDVKSLLDNLKQQGITDLQAYLQDHPSVIEEAIQRVKLCDVNQQSLKLFGAQSKAELLASLETVFVPETKQIFMEEMIALAAGQSYFEAETTMQTLQGERRHILFTMTFPPDAASYKQVLVSVLDISDRVRAEQECQRLLQQEIILREAAEASKRVRDEFLTVLSHELRTPLHLILAWATLIQQGTVSAEELPQVLDTIVRNAQHQVQMVTDLLDLSQILQGQFKLMIRPVDLKDPIEEALQTVQLAAQAKSIQIQTQLDPNVGLVLGDSKRLQQIIWNLLSNAIKFTPNDGNPTGRIEVRLEQVDNQVQMTIADTGKGIAPDLLPYLFQRFYQEDSTITRKFGGLGIGLSIVRHLVELHGGTVSVNSAGLGRGATFIVKLPVMARQDG